MNLESLLIPETLPIMVLPQAVLLPHSLLPLHIFEEKYRRMLAWSLEHSRIFGITQALDQPDVLRDPPDVTKIIGIGLVRACVAKPDGTSDLILHGLKRVRVLEQVQTRPFRMVRIEDWPTVDSDPAKSARLTEEILEECAALQAAGRRMPGQMLQYLESVHDPEVIGDLMSAAFMENPALRQETLAEADLPTRLETVLTAMRALISPG